MGVALSEGKRVDPFEVDDSWWTACRRLCESGYIKSPMIFEDP